MQRLLAVLAAVADADDDQRPAYLVYHLEVLDRRSPTRWLPADLVMLFGSP